MASPVYRSRKPKASPLWQCLFRHFDVFLGQYEERYRKRYGFLRPIIPEVLNKFLDCGDLEHGFARIRCDHCKKDHFLAFSCKGRWFLVLPKTGIRPLEELFRVRTIAFLLKEGLLPPARARAPPNGVGTLALFLGAPLPDYSMDPVMDYDLCAEA